MGRAPLPGSLSVCLEDLRAQIAAIRRAAVDRRDAIRGASQRGDTTLVQHELKSLRVLSDRAAQLSAEANNCH